MSKAGKARKHADKMRKRRAEKAAKRAAYAALAGTSKKNKRINKKKSKIAGPFKHAHIMKDCGNPGCNKCYPRKRPLIVVLGLN
jgi:hypothetical protein